MTCPLRALCHSGDGSGHRTCPNPGSILKCSPSLGTHVSLGYGHGLVLLPPSLWPSPRRERAPPPRLTSQPMVGELLRKCPSSRLTYTWVVGTSLVTSNLSTKYISCPVSGPCSISRAPEFGLHLHRPCHFLSREEGREKKWGM